MLSETDHREATDLAQRRALASGAVGVVVAALVLGLLLSLLALNLLVSVLLAVMVMVVAGAIWVLLVQSAFAAAEDRVLADIGREPAAGDLPGLRNALESVALLTGVPEPGLRVVDSPVANAMVTSGAESGTVVVTAGLLDDHSAVEAEVLAAELLCRLRDGSARYATLVAGLPPLVRSAAGLSDSALVAEFGDQWALREDLEAVSVTRYPPGLISAFERMRDRGTGVEGVAVGTAPLWIAPALGPEQGVDPAVDRIVNQSIDYRIDALREL